MGSLAEVGNGSKRPGLHANRQAPFSLLHFCLKTGNSKRLLLCSDHLLKPYSIFHRFFFFLKLALTKYGLVVLLLMSRDVDWKINTQEAINRPVNQGIRREDFYYQKKTLIYMQMYGRKKCMLKFIFNGCQISKGDKRHKLMASLTHYELEW